MGLPRLVPVVDIKRRLAGSLVAALSLATLGTAVFGAVPASAATVRASAPRLDGSMDGFRSTHPVAAPTAGRLPSSAPRVAPACNSQFNLVPGSNPGTIANVTFNNALGAVSATDIWAAGAFSSGGSDQTLTERWDGSSWTAIASPNPDVGHNDFWGLSVVPGATMDANNIWAVGNSTDSFNVEHTMAAQYNGTNWVLTATGNVGAGNNSLRAVAAISSSDIWAVGFSRPDNNTATNHQPLIEHYNGTSWSVVSSPAPPIGDDELIAVAATAPNDVWAVGIQGFNTLIEHYDGTAWTIKTSPNQVGAENILYGVTALSTTAAWAVGAWLDTAGHWHNLLEHWDGTNWSLGSVPDVTGGVNDNYLFSVSAVSATNIWVGGAVYAPNSSFTPGNTLVEHWDGSQWKVIPSVNGATGNFNEINAILATSATNVWAAGDYVNASNQDVTLFENLCINVPTVTSVAPISGNQTGGAGVAITGTDFNFATGLKFGGSTATGATINSNTQITVTAPPGIIGTTDVTVTNYAGTSAISPADTYVYVPPAISWQQYTLTGSNGTTWQPIDATNLSLTFTPSVASSAVLSGNADLWTSVAGVNQDLGIMVSGGTYGSGLVVGWKESGGFAGTFSPNAAFVQTVIPVAAATAYTAELVWKSNKATSGTIYVAAGNGMPFSPSRLTAELLATPATNLQTVSTNSQYSLAGSNGTTWQDMDSGGLLTIASFTPASSGLALVSANADLWTATAGVNQDLGIFVSGGAFGPGQIVGWKESGGFAGTFSPNAAYAQSVIQLASGIPYTFKVQWKSNKPTAGTIFAAAGNTGNFSPTRLTVRLFPAGTGLTDGSTNLQYSRTGSTGSDWMPIDATGLKIMVTPASPSSWVLSANADLWTATAGVNQDLGIFISGGVFGTGTLVAWKESGGFAGTFSPNAAFVQTVLPLASGTTYTILLEWKANKATGGTIYAAAGGGPAFSPTRVTAQLMG